MPKCKKCHKDYYAGVKAAYKLGFLNGENQLKQTINVIQAANAQLFKELLRLDKVSPVAGDPKHITITFKISFLKKLIEVAHKGGKDWHAKILSKQLREHKRQMIQFYSKINKYIEDSQNTDDFAK